MYMPAIKMYGSLKLRTVIFVCLSVLLLTGCGSASGSLRILDEKIYSNSNYYNIRPKVGGATYYIALNVFYSTEFELVDKLRKYRNSTNILPLHLEISANNKKIFYASSAKLKLTGRGKNYLIFELAQLCLEKMDYKIELELSAMRKKFNNLDMNLVIQPHYNIDPTSARGKCLI